MPITITIPVTLNASDSVVVDAVTEVKESENSKFANLFHQPDFSFENAITDYKRQLVKIALQECKGSRSEAANHLKISRQYLHRLINELQVNDQKAESAATAE